MYNDEFEKEEINQEINENVENKPKKKKYKHSILSGLAFGLAAGIVFVSTSYAGNKMFIKNNTPINIATPAIPVSNKTQEVSSINVPAIANAILPAMVKLNSSATVSKETFFGPRRYTENGTGTGIIIGKNENELLILTNAHVVHNSDELEAVFVNDKSITAHIKGASDEDDVAVVSIPLKDIDADTMSKIAIAPLDYEAKPVVGEQVIAIGNARGEGQSVTVGYISALNRSITLSNYTYTGLIMTDAAINSGNSGGALIDASGKVIGINFAKDGTSGVDNMAYSIPIAKVKDLINSLMTQKTRSIVDEKNEGFLGISGVDITANMYAQYGYPQGVMIRGLTKDSAAGKAGLNQYDIIYSFDNKSVTSLQGLQNILKYYKVGETVSVSYYHLEGSEYVKKEVNVTLGKKTN